MKIPFYPLYPVIVSFKNKFINQTILFQRIEN